MAASRDADPLPLLQLLLSGGLLLAAGFAYPAVPGWVFGVAIALAVLGALRVPRRLRLVELAGAFLVLGAWGAGWPVAAPAALCLLACLAAPEAGLARLNGVDRFMLVQEYEGNPVNSHTVLDTDRPLDLPALEAAVDSLLREVPLLRSFVREGPLSAERFFTRRPYASARALIAWVDGEADERRLLQEPFDLERQPPWRLRVYPNPEAPGWRTVITVHHSLCDGTGQVLLFDALMARYAAFLARCRPEPAPLLLRHPLPRMRELVWPKGPGWIWRMIRRHVDPNAKIGVVNASVLDDEAAAAEPNAVGHRSLTLERADLERVWTAAKAYRATPNHLYLAASLRAADAWRRARSKPDRDFLVLVPADLRPLFGLEPCLGNYSGVIDLVATPDQIRAPAGGDGGLLEVIRTSLKQVRDLDQAIAAPMNLGVSSLLLALPMFRKALRDFDTSTDSFYFSFGYTAVVLPPEVALPRDVDVTRLWMLGSPAAHPGLGLGPVRDRDRVHMVVGYRRPLLTDGGAEEFLTRFQEELERLLADAPARKRRERSDPS
jgi:NRPS condensation-like uncharacterized protein